MKYRNIPFGYIWVDGKITIHTTESEVVQQIFQSYLGGNSLLNIADHLNQKGVGYLPGVTGWNKSRLARMIADERYKGDDTCPRIVESEIFMQANQLKSARNNQRGTDREAGIYKLDVPVICQKCGAKMERRKDSRSKRSVKWVCQNPDCNERVFIPDTDLLTQLTEVLNSIIADPAKIQEYETQAYEPSGKVRKTEQEINRELVSSTTDHDQLIAKMLELAALKYSEIDSTLYIFRKMKADFAMQSPLSDFSPEFTNKVLRAVRLGRKEVCVILVNGQELGKEMTV